MKKIKVGCAPPKSGPRVIKPKDAEVDNQTVVKEEKNMIRIGRPAPDFEATAFHKNEFVNVKLSDYKGKWVLLCFYPGDFTFV